MTRYCAEVPICESESTATGVPVKLPSTLAKYTSMAAICVALRLSSRRVVAKVMASANLGPGVGALVVVGVAVGGWPKQMSVHESGVQVPVLLVTTPAYVLITALYAGAPASEPSARGTDNVLFEQAVMHAAWLPHLSPS